VNKLPSDLWASCPNQRICPCFLFPFGTGKDQIRRTLTRHMHARCEWHQMLPESSAWLYKQLANNMWRLQRQRERERDVNIMWSWKSNENVWHLITKLEIKWRRNQLLAGSYQQPKVDRFRSCIGWLPVPPVWRENKDILVGKEIKVWHTAGKKNYSNLPSCDRAMLQIIMHKSKCLVGKNRSWRLAQQ